jgi:hypothetical protein
MTDTLETPPADPIVTTDPPSDPPAPAADWASGISSPEARDYVTRVGFKSLDDALLHGSAAEKRLGIPADQLVKFPEASMADDPGAYAEIMKRLGLPDDAKGYGLKPIDGVFDFAEGEADRVAATFHELGIRPDQAQGILEKIYGPMMTATAEERAATSAASVETASAALKTEWGAAYDDHLAMAGQAEASMGDDFMDWLESSGMNNDPRMIKVLARLGEATSEPGALPGGRDGGGGASRRTPAQMDASLAEFEDKHGEALQNRGHARHKWAVDERMKIIQSGTPT